MYFQVNLIVIMVGYMLITLKISVPIERTFNVFKPDVYNAIQVKQMYYRRAYIFKKKKEVSTQYVDSVRPLASETNNIISMVGCFDVLKPDVLIGFSLAVIFTMVAVHH